MAVPNAVTLSFVTLPVLCLGACQVRLEPEGGGGAGGVARTDTGGGGREDAGGGEDVAPCEPSGEEVCNGVDDDCDGRVDDGLGEDTCGEGGCRRTVPRCQGGVPTECTPAPSGPELCNDVDDDCDGETDESEEDGPLTRPCYTGPAGTEGVGECRGGARTCEQGAYPEGGCPGEVTPVDETDADDRDDDCDGLTDEGFASLFFGGQHNSRVSLPEEREMDLLQGESFTIEAWIRPETLSYYGRANTIIGRGVDASDEGWTLGVVGLGDFEDQGLHKRGVVFLVGSWPADGVGDGELLASEEGAVTVADGVWAHVAVMFGRLQGHNGSHRVSLFVDGTLVAVSTQFTRNVPEFERIPKAWIGADPRAIPNAFHGRIGDVRISRGQAYPIDGSQCHPGRRCFDPATCLATEESVLAHWPLSEGKGNTARDVSGRGLDGTITGATAGDVSRWRPGERCTERLVDVDG